MIEMSGTITHPLALRQNFSFCPGGESVAGLPALWGCPYNGAVSSDDRSTGRILAIDLGERTMGLAVSDLLGVVAQGLPTLRRTNRKEDLGRLSEIVASQEVVRVVIGNPLHLSGDASPSSARAAAFAEILRRELNCPVELWDERLTTAEADRVLRAAELSRGKRRKAIDRLAATLLLQSYLDAHRLPQVPAHG